MRMQGRIGLITAGGSGMGRAGALRLAAEGAKVAIADVNGDGANSVVAEIKRAGGEALALVGDLRADDFATEIVSKTLDAFGGLDFLWNHLGIPGPAAIEDLDMEAYEQAFDLNLRSGLMTTKAAIPALRESGQSSVLFTASASGVVGSPMSPIYSATKFGQIGLMKSLAKRYGPHNIRFNAIAPGAVDTPMLRVFFARPDSGQTQDNVETTISQRTAGYPLGRIATPDDIAHAALFLLSHEAAFITGTVLLIDGGMNA